MRNSLHMDCNLPQSWPTQTIQTAVVVSISWKIMLADDAIYLNSDAMKDNESWRVWPPIAISIWPNQGCTKDYGNKFNGLVFQNESR